MDRSNYQICAPSVMDTTDPDIAFHKDEVRNYCHSYDESANRKVMTRDVGRQKVKGIVHSRGKLPLCQTTAEVNKNRKRKKDKKYTCERARKG